MNVVAIIGRLTRDPETRYTQEGLAVTTMTVAIDRPPRKDGTKETDFPRVQVFGRSAENCQRYLKKGMMVGVNGKIQTGSYTNKAGDKVYTTDVVADRVTFVEWADNQQAQQQTQQGQYQSQQTYSGGYGQPGQSVQPNPQFSATTNPAVVPSNQYPNQQQMPAGWEAIQDDNIPF